MMRYELFPGKDPLNIAEQEYASAKKIQKAPPGPLIQFTAFTSCIGVIAKAGETLTGIHLVMVGKPDDPKKEGPYFGANANDVPLVISKLPKLADKITVFGCIDVWRNPANGVVRAAFEQLTGTLKDKVTKGVELYQQSMREGGTYGAEIGDAGEIKIKLIF